MFVAGGVLYYLQEKDQAEKVEKLKKSESQCGAYSARVLGLE